MAPPLVDRAVLLHPAQSESEYPLTSSGASCQGYWIITRGALSKYRLTRLSFFHAPLVGLDFHLQTYLNAY